MRLDLDSSLEQTQTRHSPGNICNAEKLDAPMGLDAVDVQTAGAGCAGGDDGVIEDGFDDGLLGFHIQIRPLLAQYAAGGSQVRRGEVVEVVGCSCRRSCMGDSKPLGATQP
jgi:hypothetical protein